MAEQKKLEALMSGFSELDEDGKDYIRDLTRKLADIHCGGGFSAESKGKNREIRAKLREFNSA